MILYVNGDSNTAAGEAVNDYCFAEDDPKLWAFGRAPHPDNLEVSWGNKLSLLLGATLHCDAESASSNSRIARTTEEYLSHRKPDLLVIGWSTWEREEWFHQDRYYQVNAGGIADDWPETIKDRYRTWIADLDYQTRVNKAHRAIHNFHIRLSDLGINHFFFSCFEPFTNIPEQLDWDNCYLGPYDKELTYYNWCKSQGFKTTKTDGYHYGPDAHHAWANFLYPQIIQSCLTKK
jgi:hypothetical protein